MQNNFVIFDILGIKHENFSNSFYFADNAECKVDNDKFIESIVISADISRAIFYLHDSIQMEDKTCISVINYLYQYLGSMMISLLKNSLKYSNVSLAPVIRCSMIHFNGENGTTLKLTDSVKMRDELTINYELDNGNDILSKWIQDVDVLDYTGKQDKYDILFLLLQGKNIVQKYMAMYAFLMSLVKEIYSQVRESQKKVVQYVTDNCSRVGISLINTPCNRPGATATEVEDQFTALRNKIGHPDNANGYINVTARDVNELASIICCAIEDLPS